MGGTEGGEWCFFFLMSRRQPGSTLFPDPTLFRSGNNIIRNEQTDADKAADNPGPDGKFATEDHPEWGEDDIPNGGIPGSLNYINNSYLNLAEVQVEALDLQIDYGIDTSVGYFGVDLAAAYLYKYDYKSKPFNADGTIAEFQEESGSYNMPEWRGRVGLWWNYDKYRSEEHTSELQSRRKIVCRPSLEKTK